MTERMHERLGDWLVVCEQVSVFFCLECLQCVVPFLYVVWQFSPLL